MGRFVGQVLNALSGSDNGRRTPGQNPRTAVVGAGDSLPRGSVWRSGRERVIQNDVVLSDLRNLVGFEWAESGDGFLWWWQSVWNCEGRWEGIYVSFHLRRVVCRQSCKTGGRNWAGQGLFVVCGIEIHDCDINADRLWGCGTWLELGGWRKRNEWELAWNVTFDWIEVWEMESHAFIHTIAFPLQIVRFTQSQQVKWMITLINCSSSNRAVTVYRVVRMGRPIKMGMQKNVSKSALDVQINGKIEGLRVNDR
jgi:hypothetical protein